MLPFLPGYLERRHDIERHGRPIHPSTFVRCYLQKFPEGEPFIRLEEILVDVVWDIPILHPDWSTGSIPYPGLDLQPLPAWTDPSEMLAVPPQTVSDS